MAQDNFIDIQMEGMNKALRELEKKHKSITPQYLKGRQAYYARKHFVPAMKRNSKTARFQKGNIISVTQAKRYAGPRGVRVGVINNNTEDFPDFSAQGLASVIEYGTQERFRETGFFSAASTGKMPTAPFLRPAWDANVKAFMKDVEDAIIKKVQKEKA